VKLRINIKLSVTLIVVIYIFRRSAAG
jgi:hypothetical protein